MSIDPISAINTGMNVVNTVENAFGLGDKRQLRQQQKLQDQQIAGAKELTDYQKQKELDMWNATNMEAQIEHIENAGMNPALIYGMKGGGGITTGSGGTPMPSGGQASDSASRTNANTGMGMMLGQNALMQAQIKLAESQANKNNVEAANAAGIDVQKKEAEIQNITQVTNLIGEQTKNTRISRDGIQLDNNLKEIAQDIQNATSENQIRNINFQIDKAYSEVSYLESQINGQNIDNVIKSRATEDIIKSYNLQLENIIAQTLANKAGGQLSIEKAKAVATELKQGWEQIKQSGKNTKEMAEAILWSSGIQAGAQTVGNIMQMITKFKNPTQIFNTDNYYK